MSVNEKDDTNMKLIERLKPRRKRILLTVETKLKIIDRLEKGESFRKLAQEYNIGQTTIRDIYCKKQDYIDFAMNSDSYNSFSKRKTLKKSMYHELDTAVYKWFQEKRAAGEPVTKSMLIDQAQKLYKDLGMTERFIASDGWINGFKGRHGIEHLEVSGGKPIDVTFNIFPNSATYEDSAYSFDQDNFEEVNIDEDYEEVSLDSKEATMQEIERMESMTSLLQKKINNSSEDDPLVKREGRVFDSAVQAIDVASCSSDCQQDFDMKHKIDSLDSFSGLVGKELKLIKSSSVLRRLKLDILKLVYDAQAEDEKST